MAFTGKTIRFGLAAFLFSLAVFAAFQPLFLDWIPDDAYISFCYGRNLAEGSGLTFNPGETVEGFSNPLWTLLTAAFAGLGLDPARTAPALSLLAAIAVLALFPVLLVFAGRLATGAARRRGAVFFLFTIVMGVSFPLVFYASSGLESTAYLLILLSGSLLHLQGVRKKEYRTAAASTVPFLLGAFMRPEGVLYLAADILLLLRRRASRRGNLLAILAPAVVFAALYAWKAVHFGSLVPNTFYAKPGVAPGYFRPFLDGVAYLVRFFSRSGLVLLLPFALVPPAGGDRYRWKYLWMLVSIQLFFIVYAGPDVLRFDRFALPFIPFYLALAWMGLGTVMDAGRPAVAALARRAATAALALIIVLNAAAMIRADARECRHDWMNSHALKALGLMLGSALPEGSTVVANEIGAVAYYSRMKVIDMLGLTDGTISRIRYESFRKYGVGSSRESVERVASYLFSKRPDCFILPSRSPIEERALETGMTHPLWEEIGGRLASSGYRHVLTIKIHGGKYENIFVDKGIDFAPSYRSLHPRIRCWSMAYGEAQRADTQ